MVKESSTSASLKEYLKRYESNIEDDKKKKKKKKKKKTEVKTDSRGVVVVDEDPVWQKPVNLDEEEDDSADEEKPQVDEDIEVKHMKRLEQLRSRRPFGVISEDGSGWVPVSENSRNLSIGDQVSDISPPRRRRTRNDTPSPERRPSLTENTDLSPPRSQQTSSANLSPPRKQRTRNDTPSAEPDWQPSKVDVDLSPPRKRRARNDSPSPEPDLKHLRSSVDDLSPPRQRRKQNQIAPQESHRYALDNDAEISDLSPPRRMKKVTPLEKERPKTGLVSGRDIKEEITKTKEEEWFRFKNLDPSVSGRGAEPVYRNKITGERMSKEEFLKSREKKKEEKPKEIKLEWGKGLAQKRESEQEMRELELEKEKPFARTRDDPDLDKELKERVRWGDPMAHLVKRKPLESVLPDLGNSDNMKESGFIIPQEVPSHSWIIRGVGAPPNRYGIKPGRHWDGVDRSTGFEKQSFKRTNEKQATEKEAYLWSVADM